MSHKKAQKAQNEIFGLRILLKAFCALCAFLWLMFL
jgi:hypothetical protein